MCALCATLQSEAQLPGNNGRPSANSQSVSEYPTTSQVSRDSTHDAFGLLAAARPTPCASIIDVQCSARQPADRPRYARVQKRCRCCYCAARRACDCKASSCAQVRLSMKTSARRAARRKYGRSDASRGVDLEHAKGSVTKVILMH
eukprot:6179877-Pleurochrysis_carterae.AAC.10